MLEEFDDVHSAAATRTHVQAAYSGGFRQRAAIARLVARLYKSSSAQVRAEMLSSLLRPLGLLSIVGVASGAFGRLLHRTGKFVGAVAATDVVQYTSEQVADLTSFVHEVNPDVLQQLVAQLAENPVGMTTLSAAVLLLLNRRLRDGHEDRRAP